MTVADILFVDDEQSILNALKRVFHDCTEYTCHFADSPMAALEILANNRIAVIVSDHKMPQMSGAEFLARVKGKRPDTVRIMLTGQADLDAVQRAINSGEIYRFLMKPWNDEDLKKCVADAVVLHSDLTVRKDNTDVHSVDEIELAQTNKLLEEQIAARTQQLADALYTARSLNDVLAQTLFSTTKAMCRVVELARPELGKHSRKVAEVSLELGRALGFGEDELRMLEVAALLHDCGKLSMPAYLLDKSPRDYTPQEFELYRTHPAVGIELFRSIPPLEKVCGIVRAHHERYDGNGFPDGLKGPKVPAHAYIIGLADEYDHLMNRPNTNSEYRYQYACEMISEFSDKAFPEKLVQACLSYAERNNAHQASDNQTKVGVSDLIPNTVLCRDIYTITGCLLLAQGATLTNLNIARIRSIARLDPIAGGIYISAKSTPTKKPAQV